MATLPVQQIAVTGLAPAFSAAAAGGDQFANDGQRTFAYLKNANVSLARTVNFISQKTIEGDLAVGDRPISVPASGEKVVGPLDPSIYNDSNGRVQLTYSSEADLTIAIFKL